MTDARVRQAERRWRTTGTVQDEASYLLERVRSGELASRNLELAALLGNSAAGVACRPQVYAPLELEGVLDVLDLGPVAVIGVVAAVIHGTYAGGIGGERPSEWRLAPDLELHRAVIQGLVEWSRDPTDQRKNTLVALGREASMRGKIEFAALVAYAAAGAPFRPNGLRLLLRAIRDRGGGSPAVEGLCAAVCASANSVLLGDQSDA